MNFGKWITLSFVLFALFIATLVTVCVRQDIPLVSKQYYDEELLFQEQIQRVENTKSLSQTPAITIKDNSIKVTYTGLPEVKNAELKLFRPSDAKLDESFVIKPTSSNTQQFRIRNPVRGLYKARLRWEEQGKEYFLEKILIL